MSVCYEFRCIRFTIHLFRYLERVKDMATKSILKNIVISNDKEAAALVSALENSKNKGSISVHIARKVRHITKCDAIRQMFGLK